MESNSNVCIDFRLDNFDWTDIRLNNCVIYLFAEQVRNY